MKDLWLKLGCFLTGYNYDILKTCSEVAAKSVKRYTAAMFIICIIWAFVGYTFTQRYLHGSVIASLIGALILMIIIIQVERQIILSVHKNIWLYTFRAAIAILMAIIGSLIIDQIIFKEDIEQQRILELDEKINKIYPGKASELNKQINELDSAIDRKEKERNVFVEDINKNPTIKVVTTQSSPLAITNPEKDSSGVLINRTRIINATSQTLTSVQNPKLAMIQPLDQQIASLRIQKAAKDSVLLTLRPSVENEIKSKVGFLDELNVMMSLLSNSKAALIVWMIWLFFLLGIELFILVSKTGEKKNDYDSIIMLQMNLHIKKIGLLDQTLSPTLLN